MFCKSKSLYSRRRLKAVRCTLSVLAVGLVTATGVAFAQNATIDESAVRISLSEDGTLSGRVFTVLDSEEAPVVARVTLNANGKIVATSTTDVVGNFSFADVEPGVYQMVGVSGEYVGGQSIVVAKATEGGKDALELRVSTATGNDSVFSNVTMDTYSAVSSNFVTTSSPRFVSSGGTGRVIRGAVRGGGPLRRLLLIGGAVAVPVAVSGQASPDN